jgi:hypothetical protein
LADAQVVVSQGSALVNYHYDELGVRIVDESGVRQFGWDGELIAEWTAERPLLSSGYLDGQMVVGDAAMITTLDQLLFPVQETTVIEACVTGVMVSGGRFVCGPDVDWDRVFYTYATDDGTLLATSAAYTYNGIPILPVPGRDMFVTVTVDSSPSDYHLYTVDETDTPVFVNESPYHGDFAVTTVVGFIGNPATHLVTTQGLMLSFMNADCNASDSSLTTGCFVKDGNLGTLPGSAAAYAALSNEQEGEVYALVDPGSSYSEQCSDGCQLQRIDVAERLVSSEKNLPKLGIFDADTLALAYYLIPSPDGESVWLIRSGRSIHEHYYDESLLYDVHVIDMPRND